MFQAFLYAWSHTTVRILESASGHLIKGAEKENSGGIHIDTTFSAWSILRSSILQRYEATSIAPSITFLCWAEESNHMLWWIPRSLVVDLSGDVCQGFRQQLLLDFSRIPTTTSNYLWVWSVTEI